MGRRRQGVGEARGGGGRKGGRWVRVVQGIWAVWAWLAAARGGAGGWGRLGRWKEPGGVHEGRGGVGVGP